MEARLLLHPDARQVSVARRFVAESLGQWDGSHDPAVAMLLTDELVTNAIVHARTDATVVVRYEPPVLTVEVHDQSDDLPQLVERGFDGEGGRGLHLVDRFADHWGVRVKDQGGKAVWFDLTPETRA